MYDIMYGGMTARQNRLLIKKRPDIPSPEKNYNVYDIPWGVGKLYQDLGTVNDMEIDISLNFIAPKELWSEIFRNARRWLLSGADQLVLEDDQAYYYRVKKVNIGDAERTIRKFGNFTATFVCEGYQYVRDGARKMGIDDVTYNPYDTCKPQYFIEGEGLCQLSVNGKRMAANVGQNLTIDTGRMIAYREDGELQNTEVSGDYENLWLKPGENRLAITDGFALHVVPNWRCL